MKCTNLSILNSEFSSCSIIHPSPILLLLVVVHMMCLMISIPSSAVARHYLLLYIFQLRTDHLSNTFHHPYSNIYNYHSKPHTMFEFDQLVIPHLFCIPVHRNASSFKALRYYRCRSRMIYSIYSLIPCICY